MPVKRSNPFAKRTTPRKRRAAPSSPILTGADEKRELILAHAAMRRARDPVQTTSLWAGVVVSFLVIVVVWAWAFIPGMIRAFRAPLDPESRAVIDDVRKAASSDAAFERDDLENVIKETTEAMEDLSRRAKAQQDVLDRLAASVNATSTTGTDAGVRTDLVRPAPSQSPTATTSPLNDE